MARLRSIAALLVTVAVASACAPNRFSPAPPSRPAVAPAKSPDISQFDFVDPDRLVPTDLLTAALVFYVTHLDIITNPHVISIIDFGAYSGNKRWYFIDMKSGAIWSTYVAHGMGSDPNWTGYATIFSNTENSDETSLGFYLTAETYNGDNGFSERLDGLSPSDSNARPRDIVIHQAAYVHDAPVKQGRSDGCFAIPDDMRDAVIAQVSGGSLIFAGVAGAPGLGILNFSR